LRFLGLRSKLRESSTYLKCWQACNVVSWELTIWISSQWVWRIGHLVREYIVHKKVH
jgi:hypothetical protein